MFSNFPDSSLKNSSQIWGNLLPFEPMSLTVNSADKHQGKRFFSFYENIGRINHLHVFSPEPKFKWQATRAVGIWEHTTKQTCKRGKKIGWQMEQMKTLYQIDQNIHYVGAGTQQPAEIPNLKPAVSDFVREYLLRNSHSPWILNCLRNPSSCDKGTVLNMTHLTISFFSF